MIQNGHSRPPANSRKADDGGELASKFVGGAKVAGLHVSLARCSISPFSDDFMA